MLMLRFLLLFSLPIALCLTPVSAAGLSLVPGDSEINFVGSKPDGKHKGGFTKFTVDAHADEDPAKSSIAVEIDAKSIWSDDEKLTNHLKSPDFFDVRNNPTITFESTKVTPGDKEGDHATGTITGKMTMLGKTVEIEVPIEAEMTEQSIAITAEFTIDRTKWGMTYGQGKIENDVKVNLKFVFKVEP
jgi:polyisoprenoid-binding protein YceI